MSWKPKTSSVCLVQGQARLKGRGGREREGQLRGVGRGVSASRFLAFVPPASALRMQTRKAKSLNSENLLRTDFVHQLDKRAFNPGHFGRCGNSIVITLNQFCSFSLILSVSGCSPGVLTWQLTDPCGLVGGAGVLSAGSATAPPLQLTGKP